MDLANAIHSQLSYCAQDILCYPLGREHVLSIHFSGRHKLDDVQLSSIVTNNSELLRTINLLVGGDSI